MYNIVTCDTEWADTFAEFTDRQLACSNVPVDFDPAVCSLTRAGLSPAPCASRVSLHSVPCFTIDCADTKDMDDAVSIERLPDGYILGVHIADVSSYVAPGSALDSCAMSRGTSHYLPDRTIHMLPPVLSADLCSLNPGVDRHCLSVLVALDREGAVVDYDIFKSTIRSRVKGTYDEVNAILAGEADPKVLAKYAEVACQLPVMEGLSSVLRARRIAAGASVENEVIFHVSVEGGEPVVTAGPKRAAERIVEEFMVLANGLVANYLITNSLPGVFRAQEHRGDLAEYLDCASRHDSLALSRYVHFTSPIRRLSDLKVHQVITASLEGCIPEEVHALFDKAIAEASDIALRRSRTAKNIAHACVRRCIVRFFEQRPTERFTGTVCGWDRSGRMLVRVDQTGTRLPLCVSPRVGERVSFRVRVWNLTLKGVDAVVLGGAAA